MSILLHSWQIEIAMDFNYYKQVHKAKLMQSVCMISAGGGGAD